MGRRRGRCAEGSFDRLIVSIGRVPNTDGLGADAVGLKLDERGFIAVDEDAARTCPNVWAIGDVVRGPMLAHKAEEEGVAVAERIAGQRPHIDFNSAVGDLHVAGNRVGRPNRATAEGRRPRVQGRHFPFLANGRARALGDTTGMVKVVADAETDEILGVHMVGPGVSELIAEAVVAMEFGGVRGHRAHLPRASVAVRSDQGGRARGRQARAELLSGGAALRPALERQR